MFLKHHDHAVYMDLSPELRDSSDWNVGTLRTFEYPLNISAIAIEPVSGLLAIGTASGVINIFGAPGVECRLTLPEPLSVKFLQFATALFKLVCLDDNNQLHIWDLETYGQPKLLTTARFDKTNCMTLSPSHSHAFLALQSGEIKTYDLECLRKSSYTIPNMWALYEQKMAASGMPEISSPAGRVPVETIIHPRDLNLLFVAYAGGVILSDLTQRNTLRVYELILSPGAPGGAGYGSPDLLTHRRPPVTALAMHPSGHFFAVGHADGSIAFWAVEDEDMPLLVRTIEEMDVNVVDGHKLEKYLPHDKAIEKENMPALDREPIFKLSWSGFPNSSDPRGGDTALTILGGLPIGENPGLTVHWLPAFNPTEPPASKSPGTQTILHPHMRDAMQKSLTPTRTHFYATTGITQDYLLTPRDSPHFAGAFDPVAILILSEAMGNTRVVEAYQFPPPTFLATAPQESYDNANVPSPEDTDDPSDSFVEDLASTLKSLEMNDEPRKLRLPTSLSNGGSGLLGGQLIKLERDAYERLVGETTPDEFDVALKGGFAWPDDAKANELKLSKYQPNRILVTYHKDLTVQFQDISAQLLINLNSSPIQNHFPNPLPGLNIELDSLLIDVLVSRKVSPTFIDHACIDSVQLASESLECIVGFQSGELVIYKLKSGTTALYRQVPDEELTILEHIPPLHGCRFSPYFMLTSGKGPTTAYAISDIGFIAAAYTDGSLIVVDMRGPRIILRHPQDTKVKAKHPMGLHLNRHSDAPDTVGSLTWTVSTLSSDPQPRIHLIAVRQSGVSQVFTLVRLTGSTSWVVSDEPTATETVEKPLLHGNFILDSKSGAQWKADSGRLAASLKPAPSGDIHSIWVTCGAKGARCNVDITGERTGGVNWGSKVGSVQGVQIVEKNGSHALVAFTDRHEALVYSLPKLEHLHTLQLPPLSSSLSMDETGDFIAWTRHPTSRTVSLAMYASLFDIRRAYTLPNVDLASTKPTVPSQPQPVSLAPPSLLNSWFTLGQSMTGEQLDTLLGGPDRPIPQAKPPQAVRNTSNHERDVIGAAAASTQSTLYDRLQSALNERGQMLGDLEDRFNSLEEGSKSMVTQAKRLAAAQTAKRWFPGF